MAGQDKGAGKVRRRGQHVAGHVPHGHHGGAWKVAYADFTTAMMAFFLLMWILASSSKQQKEAIARYFRADGSVVDGGSQAEGTFEGGPGFMYNPPSNGPDLEGKALEAAAQEVREELQQLDLENVSDQVWISLGPDGLVIEISDDPKDELFTIGGSKMNPEFEKILGAVSHSLVKLPNRVRLEGYTDARQYPAGATYTNWELSADRANAARRRLEGQGLARDRFDSVVGYGDGRPAVPTDRLAPANRRITITVLRQHPPTPKQGDAPHSGNTSARG
jgi:chemotaxis protein MotB